MPDSLIVTVDRSRRFTCVLEGDQEPRVIGHGESMEEAIGKWIIYSHRMRVKHPTAEYDRRRCFTCDKPIKEKADTTDKRYWCAACREKRNKDLQCQRLVEKLAVQLFPEMLDSAKHPMEDGPGRYPPIGRIGIRADLANRFDSGRYAVTSGYTEEGVAWVWVFDKVTEAAVKKQVSGVPELDGYSCSAIKEMIRVADCIEDIHRAIEKAKNTLATER